MLQTSEWVSLGHPDKVADYISSYLLDRHLERDPRTRFAVEVMVKDQIVTLGGEIASEADFSDDELTQFVTHLRGEEITIEFDGENVINLDGEAYFTDRAVMRLLPGAVNLIVPKGMKFFGNEV